MYIESEDQLRELYGFPKGRAKDKQLDALEKHSINFIEHSPFVAISTYSQLGGLDCSPRGGMAGVVKVIRPDCIVIPDSKGNNRLDSLVNIITTGGVGCLFLIPGVDEVLRVNGTARISTAPEYLELFQSERNPPKACIEVQIKEVFLHCAKALMRANLWQPETYIERSSFPTMAQMINDQLAIDAEPESHEAMLARYQKDL